MQKLLWRDTSRSSTLHLSLLHTIPVGMGSTKVIAQRKKNIVLILQDIYFAQTRASDVMGGVRGLQHQPTHGLRCRMLCGAAVSLLSSFSPFTFGCITTCYCALYVQGIPMDIQTTSNVSEHPFSLAF